MGGMGPAQKPASTRARRNSPATRTLRAAGRGGKKAPPWPLGPDPELARAKRMAELTIESMQDQIAETSDRRKLSRLRQQLDAARISLAIHSEELAALSALELAVWAKLWRKPQAVMWEESAEERSVAVYVRCQLRAEAGDLKAATEARQREYDLGLNPKGLSQLKCEIERADEAEDRGRQRRQRSTPKAPSKKPAADPRSILSVVS